MINTNTLARPYAKAAFEFASAAQQADAWLNMLSLSAAAVQAPAMAQQLVNPALTDEQKVNVLAQLCAGHIDASFSNFLRSLGVKGEFDVRGSGVASQNGATARRVNVSVTYAK